MEELRKLRDRNIKNADYLNKDLFRMLRHIDIWIAAYQKLSKSQGSLTQGTDGNTIDGMSLKKLAKLQESVLKGTFK
jgi:hypothetical protein